MLWTIVNDKECTICEYDSPNMYENPKNKAILCQACWDRAEKEIIK